MLKVRELVEATGGQLLNGNEERKICGYKIDSRECNLDDFYIPLLGENVDGHKYILDCVKKRCSGFFISKMEYVNLDEIININHDIVIIQVKDTKKALEDIGVYNRLKNINTEVIAITGSVGKTSTRQMIASVLEEEKNIMVTQKNMNSHIGMPLMDLKLNNEELAVLEAGIDFVGEMDILNRLLAPDVAVITNIGTSHIGKFGSQEIIFREKTNISNGLKGKKILLLNGDDEYLKKYTNDNVNIMYYSISDAKNINVNIEKTEYDIKIYGKMEHIIINAIGDQNILNSIVAIKIAQIYNLRPESIIKGVAKYRNFERRMEKIELNDVTLIDDTYNASPTSALSGLKSVDKLTLKRKIAVLADILELGDYSKELHESLGESFKELNFDIIIGYGKDTKYLCNSAKKYVKDVYYFEDVEQATQKLKEIIQKEDVVYFKGSNAMKVNSIIDEIKKDLVN